MDFTFIDQLCEEFIERGAFPSVVVSVYDKEGTLYRKGYGVNDIDGKLYPVNEDTVYDVASLSKIATTTMLMLLMEEGKLTLDTKIADVLTEIQTRPNLYERVKNVDMYQLLTHSSGILDWYPFYVQAGQDFYDVFESFIGDTEIQQGTVYSDMNFMLLGKVVEKIKGKPLPECLQDLKETLGAKRLEFLPNDLSNMAPSSFGNAIEEEMVAERNLVFENWRSKEVPVLGGVNDGNAHYFFDDVAGHAGVFADVDAYERIGRLYMTKDFDVMVRSLTEQEPGRGLGWQIHEMFPQGAGHTGFTGTSIWVSREKNIGAIAFTNRLYFKDHEGVLTQEFRKRLSHAILEAMQA